VSRVRLWSRALLGRFPPWVVVLSVAGVIGAAVSMFAVALYRDMITGRVRK